MCKHNHVRLEGTGSIRFSGGELLDDTQVKTICLDCGGELDDSEFDGLFDNDPEFEI